MRINGVNHSNIHPYKRPEQYSQAKPGTGRHDQIEISQEAKQLLQNSHSTMDRQEKIDAIKEKIDTGQYHVDAYQVAKSFYEFWMNK
jgi:negative regulator of flagellin synthesis FlgM